MGFLSNLFDRNDESKHQPTKSNEDFWKWFSIHENEFFNVVKNGKDINSRFFEKMIPELDELRDGYYFVTGMVDSNTAKLVFSAEGVVQNVVFIEKLIADAPYLPNWKFGALKSPRDLEDVNIKIDSLTFNKDNLSFYPVCQKEYPDLIDLRFVLNGLNQAEAESGEVGLGIFLDNYLGELDFLTNIDNYYMVGADEVTEELIPVEKLRNYLFWRQKEFVEKYEGSRYDTENDDYAGYESNFEDGSPCLSIINVDLLRWDKKASHPWIAILTFGFDGHEESLLPSKEESQLLNEIEDELFLELKDHEGYLYIGRQTGKKERDIYFACKEFRKPSLVFDTIMEKYKDKFTSYCNISKDKYWIFFDVYRID